MLNWTLPAWGVMSVSIPLGRQVVSVFPASDDATVYAGANVGANYGTQPTLSVGTSVTAVHDTTCAALVQFDMTGVDPNIIDSALLELTVASVASSTSLLQVIGITRAMVWNQAGVTWNSAGAVLSVPVGVINAVYLNYGRVDNGNAFAGHISVRPGDLGAVKRVDVTNFVIQNSDGLLGFAIVRRMRNNQYTGARLWRLALKRDCIAGFYAHARTRLGRAQATPRPWAASRRTA
jgi:hypothetical protein